MQIVLTDVLSCPRCGPDFGLVVLADRLENRRVIEGRLGCANCRESFEIRAGLADLRFPAGAAARQPDSDLEDHRGDAGRGADEGLRLAALLGLAEARGLVVLIGSPARHAAQVVEVVPEVGVVAIGLDGTGGPDRQGVSRLLASGRLPLRDRVATGVALGGPGARDLLPEAIRLLRPGSRIVVLGVEDAAGRLAAGGLAVLLEQDEIVVASATPDG